MTVPPDLRQKGEEQCEDVIKLFLTIHPISFMSLELPELGDVMTQDKDSKHRGTSDHHIAADWVALSFRIRTHTRGTRIDAFCRRYSSCRCSRQR